MQLDDLRRCAYINGDRVEPIGCTGTSGRPSSSSKGNWVGVEAVVDTLVKALVTIELKVGAYELEVAGEMDFYLDLLNENECGPARPRRRSASSCASRKTTSSGVLIEEQGNPIAMAEHQLQAKLPAELKSKLPNPEQLQEVVRGALPVVDR